MTKDLEEIANRLKAVLQTHKAVFQVTSVQPENYQVSGTIPTMQGKKKVDGIYFASVVPKPKDVRFYFFPLYTHKDSLDGILKDDLRKLLKGKTCFHVKYMTDEIEANLQELTDMAVSLYQKDNWLIKT
jgi:hypothetical protein